MANSQMASIWYHETVVILMLDVTCPETYAPSHLDLADVEAGYMATGTQNIMN